MDRLKYIKLENEDGSYSSSIPLAVDSDHVDVNGENLTSELGKKANTTSVNSSVNNLQSQIDGLASGSPKGVYETVNALTTADPDHSKIYIVNDDGKWYYYSTASNTWVAGGLYQASVDLNSVTTIDNKIETSIGNFDEEYFDKDNVIDDAFFKTSASTQTTNGYQYTAGILISNPMYVKEGDQVTLTVDEKSGTRAYVICDDADNIVADALPVYVTSSTGFTRTMYKTGYLRIALFEEDKENASVTVTNNKILTNIAPPFIDKLNGIYEKSALTKYKGKTMSVLGDSITYGYGTTKQYWKYLQEKLQLGQIYSYGISGSTIANGQNPMYSRIDNINNSDIILIFGGTNDFGYLPVEIGNQYTLVNGERVPNTNANTFYGALNLLFGKLVTNFYNKKIIVLTPIHRQNFETQPNDRTANSQGLYLDQYVEAIKNVGKFFGIEITDLYSEFKYYPYIDAIRTAYFTDGLHPNAAGHEKLADIIIEKCFK